MMAGGPSKEVLAEIASRRGRDTVLSSVVKYLFIGLSLTFLAALLFAPLATVFATALSKGWALYFESFKDEDTLAAIRLTLTVAAIVVPMNTFFGVSGAWEIAKFWFRVQLFLTTHIELAN